MIHCLAQHGLGNTHTHTHTHRNLKGLKLSNNTSPNTTISHMCISNQKFKAKEKLEDRREDTEWKNPQNLKAETTKKGVL